MKILLVSNGPVPNESNNVVEGGGIRVWHLHNGLTANGLDCDIAVPKWAASEFSPGVISYDSFNHLFLISQDYEAVISNYAMGEIALDLFRKLPEKIIRVADLYVPIHVEVMARNVPAHQMKDEALSFERSRILWEQTLLHSDIYLVTSKEQRTYYYGLLSGLHIVNPENFDEIKMYEVPQAVIHSSSQNLERRKFNPNHLKILWWGAFYPWFDATKIGEIATKLLEIGKSVELQIVGAINPFVTYPHFKELAESQVEKLKNYPNITFIPWVNYSEREAVFRNADAALIFNKIGAENEISWRTRLLDCIEFEIPILTNGGDPFGELIISNGGGFRVAAEPQDVVDLLTSVGFEKSLEVASLGLNAMKTKFNSKTASTELSSFLISEEFSATDWSKSRLNRKLNYERNWKEKSTVGFRVRLIHAYYYYKRHGFYIFSKHLTKRVLFMIDVNVIADLFKKRLFTNIQLPGLNFVKAEGDSKGFVILLHQLDRSGAVLAGIDIFKHLSEFYQGASYIVTPSIDDKTLLYELEDCGYNVILIDRFANIKPFFIQNDLMMNSAAVPQYWMRQVLKKIGSDNKVSFFLHENEPQEFLNKTVSKSIKSALKGNFRVFVPSIGTARKLTIHEGMGISSTVEKLKVSPAIEKALNYEPNAVDVCIVGSTNDSRKRLLDVLFAVHLAQKSHNPATDRLITVSFIGITDDPIGQELTRLAESLLSPGSYRIFPKLPHVEVLNEISKCNVVVSLSKNESFGLYIAEAMSSGAVVVRTAVSGFEETVREGINGFEIPATIEGLVNQLKYISNKDYFSNDEFKVMMENSKSLIKPFIDSQYAQISDYYFGQETK
jgi:glycosyltransferase involved in cell wall biosynthesis